MATPGSTVDHSERVKQLGVIYPRLEFLHRRYSEATSVETELAEEGEVTACILCEEAEACGKVFHCYRWVTTTEMRRKCPKAHEDAVENTGAPLDRHKKYKANSPWQGDFVRRSTPFTVFATCKIGKLPVFLKSSPMHISHPSCYRKLRLPASLVR